ncbi:L-threonine ammonia-lyase-like [Anabrus simplex]|uniref:L-threonine ammonia-lyase-like n=1 Tax=Anabrus simplex TaxID=316456 RepID=UPI0035A387A3
MITPCIRSHFSKQAGMEVYLKKEFLQYTGSFKERGARYALLSLSADKRQKGVIAASAGNHAQALSFHGKSLKIPVTVVMPIIAPIMKIQCCRQYGANVIVKGNDMAEAKKIALKMGKDEGYTYINGYDNPHVLAGQGTMGLEIVEQVKDLDAVILPVGGGSMIAGVGLAIKTLAPRCKLIGVESEMCPGFTNALKEGKPTYTKSNPTLADGLAVPVVGYNSFATASSLVDKMVVVKEEWIAIAILRLVEMEKCVVEGAGATALAALLSGHLDDFKGKKIVLVCSGGNIDTTILGRCLERGLAADGRLIKFAVTVSDRPGGMSDLCHLLSSLGVSIKDMIHERNWIKSDIFSVELTCVGETRDLEHANEVKNALKENFPNCTFVDFPNPEPGAGEVFELSKR